MINKETYLASIKLDKELAKAKPSLDLLNQLVPAHLYAFPYSNAELILAGRQPAAERQVPSLEAPELIGRFINQRRPAYCLQLNETFALVLEAFGFTVHRHLARVINKKTSDFDRDKDIPKVIDHLVLVVLLDDMEYLIDVGIANHGFRGALPFKCQEMNLGEDTYRITEFDHQRLLETKLEGSWLSLFVVGTNAVNHQELLEAHRELFYTNERIPIRDLFVKFGVVTPVKRKTFISFVETGANFFKSYRETNLHCHERQIDRDQFQRMNQKKFAQTPEDKIVSVCFPK